MVLLPFPKAFLSREAAAYKFSGRCSAATSWLTSIYCCKCFFRCAGKGITSCSCVAMAFCFSFRNEGRFFKGVPWFNIPPICVKYFETLGVWCIDKLTLLILAPAAVTPGTAFVPPWSCLFERLCILWLAYLLPSVACRLFFSCVD